MSLLIVLIVVNGAEFDEMPQSAASHLVVQSLSKYIYLITGLDSILPVSTDFD